MKVASIIGARPQFIKIAPLHSDISRRHEHLIIHTGQHYDYAMSQVFFEELRIPSPDYNLGVGSASHALQTGRILIEAERVLMKERPELVIVYGDTNSTLAGALAAVKLHIPVVHVESGLRSFRRDMPEEVNRIAADHIASLLICPSETAARNLANEGISRGVHVIGDTMMQCLKEVEPKLQASVLRRIGVAERDYVLATVHRQENADSQANMRSIIEGLDGCGRTVLLPLHPRTARNLKEWGMMPLLHESGRLRLLPPLGFLEFTSLEKHAASIATDSGGVQKEAYFFGVPCVTVRDETEWVETVLEGWNVLVGTNPKKIAEALRSARPGRGDRTSYGHRDVSRRIVERLEGM